MVGLCNFKKFDLDKVKRFHLLILFDSDWIFILNQYIYVWGKIIYKKKYVSCLHWFEMNMLFNIMYFVIYVTLKETIFFFYLSKISLIYVEIIINSKGP